MTAAVAACLGQHITAPGECAPARIVVGLSGGLDSVVLLHVLASSSIPFELSALHVNHGLSPNAPEWERVCERLCGRLGIPLGVERVQVSRHSGMGLEAAAREARYRCYRAVEADWIALGHHRGDQAETLLLNLLRGAGVMGAAAMPVTRPLTKGGATVLRPLLGLSRPDLRAYAEHQQLAWVEDESNSDSAYSRNFIRNEVLPVLADRFPGAEASLARAAAHFSEAASLLAELATGDLERVRVEGGLDLMALSAFSPERRRNLLRFWLSDSGLGVPDAVGIDELLRQFLGAGVDANPVWRLAADASLRRYRGVVHLVRDMGSPQTLSWNGEGSLPWAGGMLNFRKVMGQGVSASRLQAVTVRPRGGGENFRLGPGRPSRSLKKLLQEAGIPPWQRAVLPCLWNGDELVWVHGLGVADQWQCVKSEPGWLPDWSR